MGFIAQGDGKRLRGMLICDGAGCGREIEYETAPDASIVATPPRDGEPAPVQFACSAACEDVLLATAGDGAGAIGLDDWWEMMATVLGFDDDDDDATLDADDFLAALDTLEDVVRRPGVPAGLTVRDAAGLGYLSSAHVAAALGRP